QTSAMKLAGRAKAEQSCVVDTLLVKIRKLEAEINANHVALEQLRREKVDLENALEHEQEQLFNTLGKRMDQLEAEKRFVSMLSLISYICARICAIFMLSYVINSSFLL
uniref:Uncharacterized protein n=1 Tax=Parascaris univalens TaxID=6257 RepID=A0A915ACX5_PARUN